MSVISLSFIIFLGLTSFVYFHIPARLQWLVLLVASYLFYFLNSHWLVLVLFGETLLTYFTAKLIQRIDDQGKIFLNENKAILTREEKKKAKADIRRKKDSVALAGCIAVLGILLFLKYYNFFADTVSVLTMLFHIRIPHLHLLLPVGLSFYTLQAIAYIMDVCRAKYRADDNLFRFMLFMSYFPQILQGPIPRYDSLAAQLYEAHEYDYQRLCFGSQRILWGFMKKLIIADRIAIPVSEIFTNYRDYSGFMVFLGAAFYGIQIYADFSGGMDIAIGFSEILGITLDKNFNQPYFSRSIEEFWRRWHITLGAFMRDYVFYPLSLSALFTELGKKFRDRFGNYVGKKIPAFIAMFIVYFLVGFWHGSDWKYIVYGIWNGVFISSGILMERTYNSLYDRLPIDREAFSWHLFQMIRTFFLVSVGRFFPRAASLRDALSMIKRLFYKWYDFSAIFDGTLKKMGLDTANWILLIIAVSGLLAVDILHEKNISIREVVGRQGIIFRWIIYLTAVMAVVIFGVYGPGYDAASFIYQQF